MGLIHSRLFQSTLPRRERRKRWFRNADFLHFNPRSREGSDQYNSVRSGAERFQSTLPRRERPSNKILSVKLYGFQSTLPRRERLTTSEQSLATSGISIHAPAKGATSPISGTFYHDEISIHAPAKGATEEKGFIPLRDMEFQSTLPRRERHPPFLALSTMTRFQSTLPRRERLPFGETGKGILNFNPRSREGSDLSSIHRQSRSR